MLVVRRIYGREHGPIRSGSAGRPYAGHKAGVAVTVRAALIDQIPVII